MRGFIILFVAVTLVNNTLLISHSTNFLKFDEKNYDKFINQVTHPLEETNSTRVHLKLLVESFSTKFCYSDHFIKKLDNHHKILTIISETVSETNLRNSSFLIAELTTST